MSTLQMLTFSQPKAVVDENSLPKNVNRREHEPEICETSICSPKPFAEVSLESFLKFAGFAKTENQMENQENNVQELQMRFDNIEKIYKYKNVSKCGYYMSGSVMMKFKKPLRKAEERWINLQLRICNIDEGDKQTRDKNFWRTRAKLRYRQLTSTGNKVII